MSSIGIFDSGVGGLTVLKALREALPKESFIYLGDTARLPYGTKSRQTIKRYLDQNIEFLKGPGIKALVVACNSASSVLNGDHWNGLPIYGVIRPGARAAFAATVNNRIGVLGTRATVESGAYVRALHELAPDLEIHQQACPLLVPLVEEGWEDDPITRKVLERYLEVPLKAGIDTLILGCTHYPVLEECISEMVGSGVTLVDSALEISARIQADLLSGKIEHTHGPTTSRIWTTDTNRVFQEIGERILAPFHVDEWGLADISTVPLHF